MEIFQRNIVGGGNTISTIKEKKHVAKQAKKLFPKININSGINEKQTESDTMLIHRFLQKKIIFRGIQDKNLLLKIINNEIDIKLGLQDAITASRDSLLSFFVKQ